MILTVGLKVPSDSAAGRITDTATATGVLGNCKGNASANAASLVGLASMDAAALNGAGFGATATTTAQAAQVAPANQAPVFGPTPVGGVQTGGGATSDGDNRTIPIGIAAGCIGLLGLGATRLRRRIG